MQATTGRSARLIHPTVLRPEGGSPHHVIDINNRGSSRSPVSSSHEVRLRSHVLKHQVDRTAIKQMDGHWILVFIFGESLFVAQEQIHAALHVRRRCSSMQAGSVSAEFQRLARYDCGVVARSLSDRTRLLVFHQGQFQHINHCGVRRHIAHIDDLVGLVAAVTDGFTFFGNLALAVHGDLQGAGQNR